MLSKQPLTRLYILKSSRATMRCSAARTARFETPLPNIMIQI